VSEQERERASKGKMQQAMSTAAMLHIYK